MGYLFGLKSKDTQLLDSSVDSVGDNKKILCIANRFPPKKEPTVYRINKLLTSLKDRWDFDVVTATKAGNMDRVNVYITSDWKPRHLLNLLTKIKLGKLLNIFVFPDDDIFWVFPALIKSWRLTKQKNYDLILVFMMPYSAGIVGVLLKKLTRLPLVLNLDDSLTCTDMHPVFPTRLHYWMMQALEDWYIRQADAIIYVSQTNLETVKQRQLPDHQGKLHLIRCAADPKDFLLPCSSNFLNEPHFKIIYTGGMNGWYEFYHRSEEKSLLKEIYRRWTKLGEHELVKIDYRSSSPMYIGKAIQNLSTLYPEWKDKIQVQIYGNDYPEFVVERALKNQNLTDIVSVSSSISHAKVIELARQVDLLFMTLPDRPDGSAGGRISLKTYEYLMSNKPILAAVPPGENWNFLEGKPGVWLVKPTDIDAMTEVVAQLAAAKFEGRSLQFDRSNLQEEFSYEYRLKEFDHVLNQVIEKVNE